MDDGAARRPSVADGTGQRCMAHGVAESADDVRNMPDSADCSMNKRTIFLTGWVSLWSGWSLHILFEAIFAPSPNAPVELTDIERHASMLWRPVPAMHVDLRFTDGSYYRNETAKGSTAVITGNTDWDKAPCRIVIYKQPNLLIEPDKRHAVFADQFDADNLAHELAHCIAGEWHPAWPGPRDPPT
jgi:hypothetical protein